MGRISMKRRPAYWVAMYLIALVFSVWWATRVLGAALSAGVDWRPALPVFCIVTYLILARGRIVDWVIASIVAAMALLLGRDSVNMEHIVPAEWVRWAPWGIGVLALVGIGSRGMLLASVVSIGVAVLAVLWVATLGMPGLLAAVLLAFLVLFALPALNRGVPDSRSGGGDGTRKRKPPGKEGGEPTVRTGDSREPGPRAGRADEPVAKRHQPGAEPGARPGIPSYLFTAISLPWGESVAEAGAWMQARIPLVLRWANAIVAIVCAAVLLSDADPELRSLLAASALAIAQWLAIVAMVTALRSIRRRARRPARPT